MVRKSIGCCIATLAFITQVSAGFVDITGGYTVLTFGDFSDGNDQIHGKLAAGGNVNIEGGFGVNMEHQDAPASINAIVAGGNVLLSGGGNVKGSIYSADTVTLRGLNNQYITVTGDVTARVVDEGNEYYIGGKINYTDSYVVPQWENDTVHLTSLPESPIDFAAKKVDATTYSNQLAQSGSTNYTVSSGVLYLEDDINSEINVFRVNASDLSMVTSLDFANLDKQYVINVDGNGGDIVLRDIDKENFDPHVNLNCPKILFNFTNTSSLEIGSFYGNLLAVNTNVTAKDGQMFGAFVANSFSGKYQFHEIIPDDFPPQTVPEGSAVSMVFVGVLLTAFLAKKRIGFVNN